jgi:metallopeptidase MepB
MNLSKPLSKQPGLLKHNDARSLFHELGHAIHSQTTRARYAIFHGITARDFGEIPSIMLENWWWTPSVIKEIGYHYSYLSDAYLENWKEKQKDPNAKQPAPQLEEEMIENLMKSRHTNEALATLKQCTIAIFDMKIHSPATREEAENMNPSELWNKIHSEIATTEGMENIGGGWEWGHGCARLGALMRGYDAGYYAYPL